MIPAMLIAMLCLNGCASLGNMITPTTVLVSQIAIDAAVGAVAGPDTIVGKAKAASIKTVASQLLAIDQGSNVAIAALQAALTAKIAALALSPADALAANSLVIAIDQMVQNMIAKPASSTSTTPAVAPTAQVAVAQILQEVINACAAYGV
jgi:hypothetical protein